MCFLPLSYFLIAGGKIIGPRTMKQLGISTNPFLETQSMFGSKYHANPTNFYLKSFCKNLTMTVTLFNDVICAIIVICANIVICALSIVKMWSIDHILTTC